jgi:hypothetical protein
MTRRRSCRNAIVAAIAVADEIFTPCLPNPLRLNEIVTDVAP